MAGILDIPDRLTSDLNALSVRNWEFNSRDHTAEDTKSCRTIFYDCLIDLFYPLRSRSRVTESYVHSRIVK